MARHVANVRVRNVGTVGGNLAFADPHSDLATLFLALDARVELVSPRGRRALPLDAFVRGPWETARAADELLTAVTLTPRTAGRLREVRHPRAAHARHRGGAPPRDGHRGGGRADRDRLRQPAARARARGGGAPARCGRRRDLEDVLDDVAARAAAAADPADDLHGSADYKREMVAVFTRRALRAAAARARGTVDGARYPHTVVA